MIITPEIVTEMGSCQQGIDFMVSNYPNGATLSEIMDNPEVQERDLHWGRDHLPTTKEDLEKYCHKLNIVNSDNFFWSSNVKDSQFVSHSKNVDNSQFVNFSKNVNNSKQVYYSSAVAHSKFVYLSKFIGESSQVFQGTTLDKCHNVYDVKNAMSSDNLYHCTSVLNGSYLIACNSVDNAHFCFQCEGLTNALFCSGLKTDFSVGGHKYYVFNQETTEQYFNLLMKQLKMFVKPVDMEIFRKEDLAEDRVSTDLIKVETDLRKLYPEEFKKNLKEWACGLKGYNEDTFNLTVF